MKEPFFLIEKVFYREIFKVIRNIRWNKSVCEFFRKNIRLFVVDFSFYVEFIFGTANDFIFDPSDFPSFSGSNFISVLPSFSSILNSVS